MLQVKNICKDTISTKENLSTSGDQTVYAVQRNDVYCENNMKFISTMCRPNAEILNVVHIFTTEL
jgi:hypothetical protein